MKQVRMMPYVYYLPQNINSTISYRDLNSKVIRYDEVGKLTPKINKTHI